MFRAVLACLVKEGEWRNGCGCTDLTMTYSGIPAADPPFGLALFTGAVQKSLKAQSGALSKCCFIFLFRSSVSFFGKMNCLVWNHCYGFVKSCCT